MRLNKKVTGVVCFVWCCLSCIKTIAQYDEKYRPQYHFSPQKGWVGDPDGLVFYKNQYHLFWWGHAVSNDLVHWKELPYPMKGGDGSFHYFSGSVVVDKKNTAGFGDSSMIAVYTMHKNDSVPEYQALSASNDGINFHFYEQNPVLDIGSTSFRDPQVFWHKPTNKWIMAAAMPHKHQVAFYSSGNLKQWQHLSDFGPAGSFASDWEVPDLFELPLNGDTTHKKWVLSIGQGPNKMQYFVGNFDGYSFVTDSTNPPVLWADYGTDFYAARTWRNVDDPTNTRTTWLGWMGNWAYARQVPSQWGKGFESIPRDIRLRTFDDGIKLVQSPVAELRMLRKDSVVVVNRNVNGLSNLKEFIPQKNVYEIEASFDLKDASDLGFNLLVGNGRKLIAGYNAKEKSLYIDRTNCSDYLSDSTFNKHFPDLMSAPLLLKSKILKLHLFMDQSSIELFANDGEIVMSATTFPADTQTGIQLFSNGQAVLKNFKAWTLASIWHK